MKEELIRNQSASTCENNVRFKKMSYKPHRRVKIRESQELQKDLSEHIHKIMDFSLQDKFKKRLPIDKTQSNYLDNSFINPKKPDIQCGSRIKQHFIQQYQEQFISEGIQQIHNHKYAVSNVLFSGLSASVLASTKWHSIQAMRRLKAEVPLCPEFKEYPLDQQAIKTIAETKQKIYKNKRAISEHQQTNENLILDRSQSLNRYLQNVVDSQQSFLGIYGMKKAEYDLIIDYATQQDLNVQQADSDFMFIQSRKIKTQQSNPCKQKEEKRQFQKKKFIDEDDVYGVQPNKVAPTRLIM